MAELGALELNRKQFLGLNVCAVPIEAPLQMRLLYTFIYITNYMRDIVINYPNKYCLYC